MLEGFSLFTIKIPDADSHHGYFRGLLSVLIFSPTQRQALETINIKIMFIWRAVGSSCSLRWQVKVSTTHSVLICGKCAHVKNMEQTDDTAAVLSHMQCCSHCETQFSFLLLYYAICPSGKSITIINLNNHTVTDEHFLRKHMR